MSASIVVSPASAIAVAIFIRSILHPRAASCRFAGDAAHLWSRWFEPDPEFDSLCKTLFLNSYGNAAFGRLDEWRKTPRSCLALVLLLNQLPRNMFAALRERLRPT